MVTNYTDDTIAFCKNFKACTEHNDITVIGTSKPTYTHIQVGDVRMHALLTYSMEQSPS